MIGSTHQWNSANLKYSSTRGSSSQIWRSSCMALPPARGPQRSPHPREARGELAGGPARGRLGIEPLPARELHQREQQVAQLGLGLLRGGGLGAGFQRGSELPQLFGRLGEDFPPRIPLEAGAGGAG